MYTGLNNLGLVGGNAAFTPASLFSSSEQGVYYDPSDLSSMYQDNTGTTAATAPGQGVADCSIGFLGDKRFGMIPAEVLQDSFATDTSGSYTNVGTPTLSVSAGELVVVNNGATSSQARSAAFATTVNATYRVDASFRRVIGTAVVRARSSAAALLAEVTSTSPTTETKSFFFTATTTTSYIDLGNGATTSGHESRFDSFTVSLIPGNHATQATEASKPKLSARYNLLTYSEQFDNAAWTKGDTTISADAATAPNGTATADLVIPSAVSTTSHRVYRAVTTDAVPHTASIYAKSGGYTGVKLHSFDVGTGESVFNLANGTVVSGAGSIASVGNGWYRLSVPYTQPDATGGFQVSVFPTSGSLGAYSGDGVSGVYLWGADLRLTADASLSIPAYQSVTDANTYDTSGFPWYLKFDGFDDSLQTAAIDFTATDKMTVFAGVTKLSDAAAAIAAEISVGVTTTAGSWAIYAPNSAAVPIYSFRQQGTVTASATYSNSAAAAPVSNVLTGVGDIAGDITLLRSNGAAVASVSTDLGTGNYGNHALNIGRRNNASLPFNGRLFPLIVRGAASNDSQIAKAERWVAGKMALTI
jgi:hypothetical protein